MLAELKVAARSLRSRPLFAVVAIATLAIGIGANAAIFAVVNAVLLRPLPFPDSHRLVSLYSRYLPATGYDFPYFALSGPEFSDVRSRVEAFAAVAAYDLQFRNLTREGGEGERILTMPVTAGFFDVLGVQPARGRTFTEQEAQRREGCLAILADDLAKRFGVDTGATVRLNDAPCEIIGVLPAGFGFRDDRAKLWTTLPIDATEQPNNRASHPLLGIARLRGGVTREQADAQLQSLGRYWSERFPDHYATGHFAVIRDMHEDLVGDQRQALVMLGGAVVFVLLIVCGNLAALLVSGGEARRREFAVRHTLGANRRRLVRQLLGEAMLLAVVGGVAGLLLSNWLLAGMLALYPQRLPVWHTISIDTSAMLFAFALVIAAGFLVGLIPALHATGARLHDSLKTDGRGSTLNRRSVATRSALVIGQLALSVVLLAGAVLMIRSYEHLNRVDLGIRPERVLSFGLSIPPARQSDPAAARRVLAMVEERIAAVPGVERVGAISNLPLVAAGAPDDFVIEGRPQPPPGTPAWNARYLLATPGMFDALGIPLRSGRHIGGGDVPGQPLVAVINETAARLFWPGDDPIGRTVRYHPQDQNPSIRIVGVVGDVRSMGAAAPAPPAIYVPLAQAPRPPYPGRTMNFVVRAAGDPNAIVPSVRAAVAAVDAGLPLANVRPMSAVAASAIGQPRFTTLVLSFFAGVAFFLAALGLYGILAYAVEQRRREIGVRMALGAAQGEVLRLIVMDGMRLAIGGIVLGVPAALLITRLMRDLLSGVTSTDPLTYVAVAVLLGVSALLASYLPARRATRVDPMVVLRAD